MTFCRYGFRVLQFPILIPFVGCCCDARNYRIEGRTCDVGMRLGYEDVTFRKEINEMEEAMVVRFAYPESESETEFTMENASLPAVELSETEKEFELTAEVPGVRKEDMKISFEEGLLTIKGVRSGRDLPKGARLIHRETNGDSFARSFRLPAEVNGKEISAQLADGILRITLPKAETALPREIEIR